MDKTLKKLENLRRKTHKQMLSLREDLPISKFDLVSYRKTRRYGALMALMTGGEPCICFNPKFQPRKEDYAWARKKVPGMLKELMKGKI